MYSIIFCFTPEHAGIPEYPDATMCTQYMTDMIMDEKRLNMNLTAWYPVKTACW